MRRRLSVAAGVAIAAGGLAVGSITMASAGSSPSGRVGSWGRALGARPQASEAPEITTGQTLVFLDRTVNVRLVDLNRNGAVDPGDTAVFRDDLLQGGRRVGAVHGQCGANFRGVFLCDATVTLQNGKITVAGTQPGNVSAFSLAVTGGTAEYQNVRGQMRLEFINDQDATLRLRLIP